MVCTLLNIFNIYTSFVKYTHTHFPNNSNTQTYTAKGGTNNKQVIIVSEVHMDEDRENVY